MSEQEILFIKVNLQVMKPKFYTGFLGFQNLRASAAMVSVSLCSSIRDFCSSCLLVSYAAEVM